MQDVDGSEQAMREEKGKLGGGAYRASKRGG